MKKLLWVSCVGLMTFVATAPAEEKKPSVMRSQKTQVKAIVEDVDQAKRQVTVRGPKGTRVITVGEDVRNLDQVKKGDEILATVYESVAYSVVKKGEAPDPATEGGLYRAKKGESPAGLAIETRQASAKVEAINPKTREMTLKGADGKSFTVNVDERAGDLSRIKKGDEVVATYTEAVAVSVQTPEK